MAESNQPKLSPSTWWVLMWAVLLWESVWVGIGVYAWPGLGDLWRSFVLPALFFGALLLPLFLLWVGLTHCGFEWCKSRRGRLRAVWMLSPALVLGGWVLVGLFVNPPSPNAFFVRITGTSLPGDAHDVRMRGNFVQDMGLLRCYFRTSEVGAKALAERLQMKEVNLEGAEDASELAFPLQSMSGGLSEAPDPRARLGKRLYTARNGETGTEMYMITSVAMTEVWFLRYPLASKTDAELAGEAVRSEEFR